MRGREAGGERERKNEGRERKEERIETSNSSGRISLGYAQFFT